MKKPSFLERLTGSVKTDAYDDVLDENHEFGANDTNKAQYADDSDWHGQEGPDDDGGQDGELPVDMYQTG
jgi:hypothetical protein